MSEAAKTEFARIGIRFLARGFLWCWVLLFSALPVSAALQFDVFLGFDGVVPEASWFPVICEIKNDGPTFTGTIEVNSRDMDQGQPCQMVVELPTGTLKRVVIPVFAQAAGGLRAWDVRLFDPRHRLLEERPAVRARRAVTREIPLTGALPRTPNGTPDFRPTLSKQPEQQPCSARLLPSLIPDNPLVWEGLTCFYLNSEKAADLSASQVEALFAWLYAGGHLVVAVEQPSDITASPWLKNIFPSDVTGLQKLATHPELQQWLKRGDWPTNAFAVLRPQPPPSSPNRQAVRAEAEPSNPFANLPDDFTFETAPMQVAVGPLRDGRIDIASGDQPLMVTANRGRGRITALLFSPEREPARSWKNLPVFWAKLAGVPGNVYASSDLQWYGGWSSDGIFGAMIDSRQVHKLPVSWLLALLVVYLVVIGPFDHYWLKRINRPMLTWITFPCYVALFSGLIYLIGYKLRAGESEWNELHVVDVLPKGESAELRGRTYASVYSPSNQRYWLEGRQRYASFRPELETGWGRGQARDRTLVVQMGDTFKAQVFVPVWMSQLYVSDWWEPAPVPVSVQVARTPSGFHATVENRTEAKLSSLRLAVAGRVFDLEAVEAGRTRQFDVRTDQGLPLDSFTSRQSNGFLNAVQSRRYAFGRMGSGRIDDLVDSSMAVSFLGSAVTPANQNRFIMSPGLDLSPVVEQGDAVLLAWAEAYAPVPKLYNFVPRRSQRHTLWRCSAMIQ